jgi:hypothetical protein
MNLLCQLEPLTIVLWKIRLFVMPKLEKIEEPTLADLRVYRPDGALSSRACPVSTFLRLPRGEIRDGLFGSKRLNNFFEARVTSQRVPKR